MSEGRITYHTVASGQIYGYQSIFDETYDEAVAILNFMRFSKTNLVNFTVHKILNRL